MPGRINTAAALAIISRSRMVHENPPHQTSGECQEMRAVLPADAAKVHQPDERLVHKCRCLQRVIIALAAHLQAGESAEFLMNDRYQFIERGTLAAAPGEQQLGHMRTGTIGR